MIKETGCDSSDMDGIASLSRQIEGVLVGVTVREKVDGRWKVSVRTFEPYDASEICRNFGGGGHPRAAGCTLDMPAREACEALMAAAAEELAKW
jgi:phosphoesterase RecJ-like protein